MFSQRYLSGSTYRSGWHNIRDQYRKSLKKFHTSGQGAKNIKPYKYTEQLSFCGLSSTKDERKEILTVQRVRR